MIYNITEFDLLFKFGNDLESLKDGGARPPSFESNAYEALADGIWLFKLPGHPCPSWARSLGTCYWVDHV